MFICLLFIVIISIHYFFVVISQTNHIFLSLHLSLPYLTYSPSPNLIPYVILSQFNSSLIITTISFFPASFLQ